MAPNNLNGINTEEEELWASSDEENFFSHESIENRRKEELSTSGFLQNIAALPNEQQALEKLRQILNANTSIPEKIREVTYFKNENKLGDQLLLTLLFECSFTPSDFLMQIKRTAPLLRAFCASKKSQRYLLSNLEQKVISHQTTLLPLLNDILYGFYYCDVLSEEVLLEWFEVPSSSVLTHDELYLLFSYSSNFITWLHQDDDDGDGDMESSCEEGGDL